MFNFCQRRAILHNPKGWECEARNHLGSPLGELCIIVLVYERSLPIGGYDSYTELWAFFQNQVFRNMQLKIITRGLQLPLILCHQ